jgi:hypothetical protein
MAGFRSWRGVPIYNVIPTFWVDSIFSLLFNIFSSIIVAPMIFFALRPEVVVISLPSGEPSVGAHLASKFAHAKVVFDVRDEWEDYVIGKASQDLSEEPIGCLRP